VPQVKYPQGKNPHSLQNLTYKGGRPTEFNESKEPHTVTITPSGWQGLKELVEQQGCSSISDFLDRLGRGEFSLSDS
jgi:hypothetical protein